MKETPKKIVGNGCFLCCIDLILTARIRVFEKSLVDIEGLIKRALEIDELDEHRVKHTLTPCFNCTGNVVKLGRRAFNTWRS